MAAAAVLEACVRDGGAADELTSTACSLIDACETAAAPATRHAPGPAVGSTRGRGRVLIVDDDPLICALVGTRLGERGFRVHTATSGAAALEVLTSTDVDTIVTDVDMAEMTGLDLCDRVVAERPDIPVIVLTGLGNLEVAVASLRAGAYDFITKPPDMEVLGIAIERAVEHGRLREEVKRLRRAAGEADGFGDLIGASPAMHRLRGVLEQLRDSDTSVLVTGESGTGKELVARALHRSGRRGRAPFVAVNCAALPDALLESELFGHVRGAFTDARGPRTGLFIKAHGGTLFLDEIGELPPSLQPKLLRALQERTVRAVGADTETPCDVRLIAATNRDLEQAVGAGHFREDLYFRVNVIRVDVPPLRLRADDVLVLAQHFIDRYATRTGTPVRGLSAAAAERLMAYGWPGNVRELQNCIERAVTLTRYERITAEDLPEQLRSARRSRRSPVSRSDDASSLVTLAEVERRHIERVLDAVKGNQARAARVLGLDRKTLYRKLRSYQAKP